MTIITFPTPNVNLQEIIILCGEKLSIIHFDRLKAVASQQNNTIYTLSLAQSY